MLIKPTTKTQNHNKQQINDRYFKPLHFRTELYKNNLNFTLVINDNEMTAVDGNSQPTIF